jgi:putative ABC transport system permease protein
MLSPRWRKVFRDAWHHKGRTMLVVFAIAIGLTGAGSVLNTWSLLRRVTHDGYLATNPASATLRLDSVDPDLLAAVKAMPAISAAQPRRMVIGKAMVDGGWKSAVLFATNDFRNVEIGKLAAESGAWPPSDGSVIIESSSVDFAGAVTGDPMTFQIGDNEPVSLQVNGIARDVGLAPGWMEHVVYAFVTPTTIAQLGGSSSLDQLQIVVRDKSLSRSQVRQVAFAVRDLAVRKGHTVFDVDVPVPGKHIHAAQINSLLMTQGIFGVLALILSGFLVVNLITAMLAGQVREIGVMKALGASSGQLASMYLGLALVLGLASCVFAIPAAMLIGRWYADFTSTLLNFSTAGFDIPRWSIVVQLAAGTLLPVVVAAFPVMRGSRISVSDALRDFGIGAEGSEALLGSIGGLSRPLLLALRNSLRKRQRTVLTLMTLALGGAVYVGALNLRTSIRDSVSYLYGTINQYDQLIRFSEPHSADSIQTALRSINGVKDVEMWSGKRASVSIGAAQLGESFPLVGIPPASHMVAYPVLAGRWLRPGDRDAIVVSRTVADDDSSISVGKQVPLVIDGKIRSWTVIGIVDTGPAPMAVTTPEAMWAIIGNSKTDLAVVKSPVGDLTEQGRLSRSLRDEMTEKGLNVASAQLTAENRRVIEDHLLMVASFLLVMSQAMIVVGGLGLASTMSLAVLERTREIGVMRAIGARHSSILGMLQVEALAMGIVGWLIAIPLSIPASVIIGKVFGSIMFPVPVTFVPQWGAVFEWLAVVIVVSIVASAWPAYRATRIPTARALSYE